MLRFRVQGTSVSRASSFVSAAFILAVAFCLHICVNPSDLRLATCELLCGVSEAHCFCLRCLSTVDLFTPNSSYMIYVTNHR